MWTYLIMCVHYIYNIESKKEHKYIAIISLMCSIAEYA